MKDEWTDQRDYTSRYGNCQERCLAFHGNSHRTVDGFPAKIGFLQCWLTKEGRTTSGLAISTNDTGDTVVEPPHPRGSLSVYSWGWGNFHLVLFQNRQSQNPRVYHHFPSQNGHGVIKPGSQQLLLTHRNSWQRMDLPLSSHPEPWFITPIFGDVWHCLSIGYIYIHHYIPTNPMMIIMVSHSSS